MTSDEFERLFKDPIWRISNIYKIINKQAQVIKFIPNTAQLKFLSEIWYRNAIPKARQRGLSTVIQILMLDTALFQNNMKGKVIAQDKDAATEIFRDKFKFAYDNLEPEIREFFPLIEDSKTSLMFSNGSSVSVTTSARSGTVQMLHVSEMGKIAAKYPQKAREIITGSIPAVPPDGFVFIESTSEGSEGEFYDIVQTAKSLKESGKKLTNLDYKLHFYSWFDADEYQIKDYQDVVITKEDNDYFDRLEHELKINLPIERRAWYVKTKSSLGLDLMYQEFPSTVDEAFMVSMEGTYYKNQFKLARQERRIGRVPYDSSLPVYTFWDIGQNDQTAIWCIQRDGKTFSVINYIEEVESTFSYFVGWLKDLGYTYDIHFMPHDATHKRQLGLKNLTAKEMVNELAPEWRIEIVPRIASVIAGINQTRDAFRLCYFDESNCAIGLKRLENYKKEWSKARGCYADSPLHDSNSNGADAFRQFAQALANGQLGYIKVPKDKDAPLSVMDKLNKMAKSGSSRQRLGM